MVNFNTKCGALALNRLVIAVTTLSLQQRKALKSCLMPQIGPLFGPRLQRAFCIDPATFAVLQQAGRGACMAVTSGLWVSTSKTAQCPELQLMALPCAHTKVGAEQELCSQRNIWQQQDQNVTGCAIWSEVQKHSCCRLKYSYEDSWQALQCWHNIACIFGAPAA